MRHLTAEERGAIEYGLEKGDSIRVIALELNRHPSTIYREIKRNSFAKGKNARYAAYPYRATNAGNLARLRRNECRKLSKETPKVIRVIMDHLSLKWSPEQIAHSIPSLNVTPKTIYKWLLLVLISIMLTYLQIY